MRMADHIGDKSLYEIPIEINSQRYKDIYRTTWDELIERGYTSFLWLDSYNLTIVGWVEGILLLERHKEPAFAAILSILMATLKGRIKGRDEEEAYLMLSEAAALTGVSESLICNILDGQLIERALGRIGARVGGEQTIEIPRRFGQVLLAR